jgi:hypothetical protein
MQWSLKNLNEILAPFPQKWQQKCLTFFFVFFVLILALSMVDREFKPLLGQTKNYKIGI